MIHKFDLKDYNLKELNRNNEKAYFDPIRRKILKANPEEEVRIKYIEYLTNELKVPIDLLDTEVALSHFQKGASGRADIIGYMFSQEDNCKYALFIVECKAPNIRLTDKVIDQALKYDEILQVEWIFLTNGIDQIIYHFNHDQQIFIPVKETPNYMEMLSLAEDEIDYIPDSLLDFKRPVFEDIISKDKIQQSFDFGWLGLGSKKDKHPLLQNLIYLLNDYNASMSFPIISEQFTIVEDGYRYTTFGNAAGGSWAGDYRYFLIKDSNSQNQVFSISILGKLYGNEDTRFPNSNGHTVLVVAIDDFDKSHNSLQLDLDKFITKNEKTFTVWHDGTMTVGNKGRVKNSLVIDYIIEKEPTLIRSNKVFIGELPLNRNIVWQDAQEFIVNLIKYALIRDRFRENY
jgi:hypothetical protein